MNILKHVFYHGFSTADCNLLEGYKTSVLGQDQVFFFFFFFFNYSTHACNPSYIGGIDRVEVQGQPEKKHETLSEK
jgi:hypothetical protein